MEDTYVDIEIDCVNKDAGEREPQCEGVFIFTAGEQKFYEDKGHTPPKRCRNCREKRKSEIEARENKNFGPNKKPYAERYPDNGRRNY